MNEKRYQLLQAAVERLSHRNATVHLTNILDETPPADIAYLFKLLNERSARTILDFLPNLDRTADVLSERWPPVPLSPPA
jgi:Mg/Co/Ni transporter MgtE